MCLRIALNMPRVIQMLLRTVRVGPTVTRGDRFFTCSAEGLLPRKWTVLKGEIEKQQIASRSQYLLKNLERVKINLVKRGMDVALDLDRLVRKM